MANIKRHLETWAENLGVESHMPFSFLTACREEIDSRKQSGAKRILFGSVVDAVQKKLGIDESYRDSFFSLGISVFKKEEEPYTPRLL
ncbi:MAG: hypothetical protein ACJKSS_02190 [Patescibacteria group bacterium UBA2103]